MTTAIIGVFLLYHFNADWGWYVAVVGLAFAEAWHKDMYRNDVRRLLGTLIERTYKDR